MKGLKSSTKHMSAAAGFLVGFLMLAGTAAAQVEIPSQVSIQGTGLFTTERDADGALQDATNSGGFIVGYGYQFNEWAGVETNYGYSRNTQNYSTIAGRAGIRSDIHQFTGALVARLPLNSGRLRPYTLAGAGALLFGPVDDVTIIGGPDRQAKPVFVYGGGVEFVITPRFGLRGEYRGFVYDTPDFDVPLLKLDRVTHLAQPSFGVYFRF